MEYDIIVVLIVLVLLVLLIYYISQGTCGIREHLSPVSKYNGPTVRNPAANGEFTYKKKKFVKRDAQKVKDMFNVDQMLPKEVENEWFDIEPLISPKRIRNVHLIHPKEYMGVNTVSSSLKNATHDIRGDIITPKIPVSPWGNSTIEPDTNLRGLCKN